MATELYLVRHGESLDNVAGVAFEEMTVDDEGRAVFLYDVYDYDEATLSGEVPVVAKQPLGSVELRPDSLPEEYFEENQESQEKTQGLQEKTQGLQEKTQGLQERTQEADK